MNNTFYGKSLRFWIFSSIGLLLLLVVVSMFIRFSFYKISITGSKSFSIHAVINSDFSRQDIQSFFGISMIPRNTEFLELKDGRSTVRSSLVDKPIFIIKELDINISPQKAVTKIGRHNLGCNISNSTGSYHYKCSNTDKIMRFSNLAASQWDNSIERELLPDSFFYTQYKEGILRMGYISSDDGGDSDILRLEYVIPGVPETKVAHAAGVAFEPNDILTLHTDVSGGDSFVISNLTSGNIYFYSDFNATATLLSRKSIYERLSDVASCSLRQTTFACYYGLSTFSPDGDEEKSARTKTTEARNGAAGSIETYDFSRKSVSKSVIKDMALDEICLAKNNQVIGLSVSNIISVDTHSTTASNHIVADDGIHINCGDTSIYTTEKGIYKVSKNTSNLLFSVDHLDISNVSAFGDSVLFNAFVSIEKGERGDSIAHTYKIRLDKDHPGIRIEDTLPYILNKDLPIFNMDYNDTTIYIQPAYSITSDSQTGEVTIDEESFNSAKSEIEDQLQNDKLYESERKIVFSTN